MCCYIYYHVANRLHLAKAVFVSNIVSKLLDTVCIISVSSLHVSRLFIVTTKLPHNIINIKLASNAIV